MGIFDKAKDLAAQHNETVAKGIDKAAEVLDAKTGGQHRDKIDRGAAELKERLDDPHNPADPPPAPPAPPVPPA